MAYTLKGNEKEIPFMKRHIVIIKDDIIYLKPFFGKKKNKRNIKKSKIKRNNLSKRWEN